MSSAGAKISLGRGDSTPCNVKAGLEYLYFEQGGEAVIIDLADALELADFVTAWAISRGAVIAPRLPLKS